MVEYKQWKDIVTIISGKNQKDVENPDGQYPIYGSGGIIGYADSYLCKGNAVVVGRKGTIDNPLFVTEPFWNIDTAFAIVAGEKLVPKYLFYFCRLFNFKALDKSTGRPSLAKSDLQKIQMPVPDVSEQIRIVDRIDELFSQLDEGVSSLKKTQEQLKIYQQAVLQGVLYSGRQIAIRDCIEDMGQGWSPKCERIQVLNDEEWAVITTTAIQPMDFRYYENKKLPSSLIPREKHEIHVGDILITRAGPRARCGICCLVRKTKKRLLNCDKVYRLKVKMNLILPEYLEVILNSPAFVKQISFCKTGGNDSGVNLTQERFLDIKIPVPTISEQGNVLKEMASRLSVCDSIGKTIETMIQQSDAMRLSILKKAFEGGL